MAETHEQRRGRLPSLGGLRDRLERLRAIELAHTHNVVIWTPSGRRELCARCLGIYGGLPVWAALFLASSDARAAVGDLGGVAGFALTFGLTMPLVIDWLTQCRAWRHSTNPTRFLTGLALALGAITLLVQYRYLPLFGPLALGWAIGVSKLGQRWRIRRPPYWGCEHCETGTVGELYQRRLE